MNIPTAADIAALTGASPDDPRIAIAMATVTISNDLLKVVADKDMHVAAMALVGVLAHVARQSTLTEGQIIDLVRNAYKMAQTMPKEEPKEPPKTP
jgi:hypothetical protein